MPHVPTPDDQRQLRPYLKSILTKKTLLMYPNIMEGDSVHLDHKTKHIQFVHESHISDFYRLDETQLSVVQEYECIREKDTNKAKRIFKEIQSLESQKRLRIYGLVGTSFLLEKHYLKHPEFMPGAMVADFIDFKGNSEE